MTTIRTRRNQRGARPGATNPFHELVKLDQRARSCRRATGSSPLAFLVMSVGASAPHPQRFSGAGGVRRGRAVEVGVFSPPLPKSALSRDRENFLVEVAEQEQG
jgi:hypothetical protein